MDNPLYTKCLRCNGAVIYDKFYDRHEQFWGWRCLICGDIVDPIILKNRQLAKAGQMINQGRGSKKKDRYRLTQNVETLA
jgi:hypothetical protein